MVKRAATSKAGSSKKQKILLSADTPLDEWRVVLTGEFILNSQDELVAALKSKGVAITSNVSGKTTHLIIGNRSSTNKYGHKTGVGSSKHTAAVERGLPMITEDQVWERLNTAVQPSGAGASSGVGTPASASGVMSEEAKVKPTTVPKTPRQSDYSPYEGIPTPVKGTWRGLFKIGEKTSKSGRAKCKGCNKLIEKGATQVQVRDDSLFRMIKGHEGGHEGASRGYVESFAGFSSIGRKTFKVHKECLDKADEKGRREFNKDWAKVRTNIIDNIY